MSFLQLLDGSLLISDHGAGAIYRVTYKGSGRSPPPPRRVLAARGRR